MMRLIALPGFMGQPSDFEALQTKLKKTLPTNCSLNALPLQPAPFKQADWQVWLDQQQPHIEQAVSESEHCFLLGYSLGGRTALGVAARIAQRYPQLKGLILIAAHAGLPDPSPKRQQRLINDKNWANRFEQAPLKEVLQDWYQQAVFGNLTESQKTQLISQKLNHQPQRLARQLITASLSDMPDYFQQWPIDSQGRPLRTLVLNGQLDEKFSQYWQAQNNKFITEQLIHSAGHILLFEAPAALAQQIKIWSQHEQFK